MKNIFLLIAVFSCCGTLRAQYWQQKVDFRIDVQLNEREKTLDAFEKLNYVNNSPDTLSFIWFHLWPNAYKNDRTAFSEDMLLRNKTAFYFSTDKEKGYINQLDFKVNGITAKTEDHPSHIDIIKLLLPNPLAPGRSITITTPFHVKLPFNFSRGGYDGASFQVTQWFPKPAVYDRNGWHPMPYLDQGEFYSEFGDYDVRITVPKNFVVAATGSIQDEQEKEWLKTKKYKPGNESPAGKKNPTDTIDDVKTLHFEQHNVHDFAWFADKRFQFSEDTLMLPSGRIVHVGSYYFQFARLYNEVSVAAAREAARFYSKNVGEYPYPELTIVQGPESFGGGMEYPTITVISPIVDKNELSAVIAHEVGHNWFQGMLASNERQFPWMDEGFNTFYEYKFRRQILGRKEPPADLLLQTIVKHRIDQPINTSSEKMSELNYGLVTYHKTSTWLQWLEDKYGTDSLASVIRAYFDAWQFRHPSPEDFRSVLINQLGVQASLDYYLIDSVGRLPSEKRIGFRVLSPFKKGSIRSYLSDPVANTLLLSPAIGANYYDKFMLGALISNYKQPPNDFQYLIIPLYGFGSGSMNGIGRFDYSRSWRRGAVRKADIFIHASSFTSDAFKDDQEKTHYLRFAKLVPGISLTFREKDPLSTVKKTMGFKTYLIRENALRVQRDTIFSGLDTIPFLRYLQPRTSRYLNQFRFSVEDSRALYPFSVAFQVEQAKDFVRPAITANYFFNYREGGLQLRAFAGKFIYIGNAGLQKQFRNDRYFLNLSGANGSEDYTYSDYFLGRNEFEGLSSQQMMMRDGGFKVRTELLSSKIGKTDDWLASINLNSSIPRKFNPLSVLPVNIPLHVFMDIGTYAEAWKKDATTDRLLYDIGVHVPLLAGVINLYFPVLYNKVYGDYFKSTISKNRFLKTMSFTINFYNSDSKKLNRILEF